MAPAQVQFHLPAGPPGHLHQHVVPVAGAVHLVAQPREPVLVEVGVDGPPPVGTHLDARVQAALVPRAAALGEAHAVQPVEVALVVAVQQGQRHTPVQGHQGAEVQRPSGVAVGLRQARRHLAEEARVAEQPAEVAAHRGVLLPVELEPVVGSQRARQRHVEAHVRTGEPPAEGAAAVAQVAAVGLLQDRVLLLQLVEGAVVAVLLEAAEAHLGIVHIAGVHLLLHVGIEALAAVEHREVEVAVQFDGGRHAAVEEVLVHAGVGGQPGRIALHVEAEGRLAGEGEARPVGEAQPELRLVVAHGQRLQPPEVAQEEVRAVEVEALPLGAAEELLAFVLLGGDAQADVVAVTEAVAGVELVRVAQVEAALAAQAVAHRLVTRVRQRVAIGIGVAATEQAAAVQPSAPRLHVHDRAQHHLVLAVAQDLLQPGPRTQRILAHRDEGPHEGQRAGVPRIDRLHLVQAQQLAVLPDVREQGADLHVGEQRQAVELIRVRMVQVDGVAVAVREHIEQVGQVQVTVVAQLLGGGLDALLDEVARHPLVLLRRARRRQRDQHHRKGRAPHGKR
ncbi:MAG: hypothetical protein GFGODING_02069 [Flavobacteriales bacterium]|nr:hypothetical protein [Flavobacteriales bacterium]